MTRATGGWQLAGVGFAFLAFLGGLVFPIMAMFDACAAYGVVLVSWPLWMVAAATSASVAWAARRRDARMRNAALLALSLNLLAFATAWLPFHGSCS